MSDNELYEIQDDDAYRHFRAGMVKMHAGGRCDTTEEWLKTTNAAFAELEQAHAIEPDNPHIVYQMAWCKEFLRAPPDEMVPILELALQLCNNPAYQHTGHIVDLVTYAITEYRKQPGGVDG